MSKRKRHNYQRALRRKARGDLRFRRGTVSHVDVWHDDTCSVWTGGACDCEDLVFVEHPGEATPYVYYRL